MLLTVAGSGRWLVTTAFPKSRGPIMATVPGANAPAAPDPTQPASLELWDLQSKSFPEQSIRLSGHYGWVDLVQSSPDGQWLITSCSRYVRFWHLPTVLAKQSLAE
jgi:WD40 repeat protein